MCNADHDPQAFLDYCRERTGPGYRTFGFADREGRAWTLGFYGGRNLMSSITVDCEERMSRDLPESVRENLQQVRERAVYELCILVEGKARLGVGPALQGLTT
jgi:hypothetical protein